MSTERPRWWAMVATLPVVTACAMTRPYTAPPADRPSANVRIIANQIGFHRADLNIHDFRGTCPDMNYRFLQGYEGSISLKNQSVFDVRVAAGEPIMFSTEWLDAGVASTGHCRTALVTSLDPRKLYVFQYDGPDTSTICTARLSEVGSYPDGSSVLLPAQSISLRGQSAGWDGRAMCEAARTVAYSLQPPAQSQPAAKTDH